MITHQTSTTTTVNNNVNMIQMPKSYPPIDAFDEAPLNLCVRDSPSNSNGNENHLQNCKVVYPTMKPTIFENNNVYAESKKAHPSKIGNDAPEVISVPPNIKKINLPKISTEVKADFKGSVQRVPIKLTKSPKVNVLIQKVKPLLPVPAIEKSPSGSTVLWNLLWALLQDKKHEYVMRYINSIRIRVE